MKLRQSHRIPALLLACLVVSLLFPEACSGVRVRVASWLPSTAAASSPSDPELTTARERNAALAYELRRAHEALDARPNGSDPPLAGVEYARATSAERPVLVPARVLHVDSSTSRRSFLIDAGSADGLRRGLAVVHGNSLVGVVQTVASGATRVLRVDDLALESALPAVLVDPGAARDPAVLSKRRGVGVARGTGDGLLRVTYLAPGEAKVGDLAVTGAGSEAVPEGLVLGRVIQFADEDRNGDWEALVEPLRDLDTLSAVYVVKRDPLPPEVAPR
jgi:rod shape-determining protein MreC